VPICRSTALVADPTILLLVKPCIQAYLLLALDVLEYLCMMSHAIIIEIGDALAGKLPTLVAAVQPFVMGTNRDRADAALGGYYL
jgi:hypothetical protein